MRAIVTAMIGSDKSDANLLNVKTVEIVLDVLEILLPWSITMTGTTAVLYIAALVSCTVIPVVTSVASSIKCNRVQTIISGHTEVRNTA